MSFFKGLLIFLCCLHLAAAMPIANLPYRIVEVRAGSKMVIPCDLTTEGVTGDEKVDFKWGFTPDGSDSYRTIVQRNDIKLRPEMPHNLRVHLHPTHTAQEDCSLVISPLLVEDSGIYEIHVTVNGAQRGQIPKTKVLVTDSPLMSFGKKFSARREAMFKLPESILNARSGDEGQTTGEEYNSMHIATDHEEQTAVVEKGQARPGKEGQARPGKEGQARPGKEGQARPGKEGQARPGKERQARPVDKGQTSGKRLKPKRKPAVHRPVSTTIETETEDEDEDEDEDEEETTTVHKKPRNHRPVSTTIQTETEDEDEDEDEEETTTVHKKPRNHRPVSTTIQTETEDEDEDEDEEETTTVHKKPRNQGKTTGKKLKAKHKPTVNPPVTTTATKQTATVGKESVLLKYFVILCFFIIAIVFSFIFIFCLGRAIYKCRKRKHRKWEESRMEEGRLEQDDES